MRSRQDAEITVSESRLKQYICPLTKKIMNDPVIIRQIYSINGENVTTSEIFEREAIVSYVEWADENLDKVASLKTHNQLVKIDINQIIKKDYGIICLESKPDLVEENKIYLTIHGNTTDGSYYMQDPAGAFKQGQVTIDINFVGWQKDLRRVITAKGHNMFLIADLSKKVEITSFLTEYPKFYDCDAIYFPRAWKNELCALICQKNLQNLDEHLEKLDRCLKKDRRLLTTKLGVEEHSPFYLACLHAKPEIVWFLVKQLYTAGSIKSIKQNRIKDTDTMDGTLLQSSITNEYDKLAKTLLCYHPVYEAGFDANSKVKASQKKISRQTEQLIFQQSPDILPLYLSIVTNNYELLKTLLIQTAAKQVATLLDKFYYFYLAALKDDVTAMTILLQAGANPKIIEPITNNTILHIAVVYHDRKVIDWLWKDNYMLAKSMVDMQNVAGDTALHLSIQDGNIDFAALLINFGASTTIENVKGEAPLDIASDKEVRKKLKGVEKKYLEKTAKLAQEAVLESNRQLAELQARISPEMSTSFSRLRGTSTDFGDSEDLHWQHPLANGAHVRCVGNSIILKMPKRTVSAYASNEDNLSAKCIFILSNGNLVTVSSQPIISIRYLDNNCYKVQRSLVGHEGTIQCVQELYQDHLVSCSHKGDMGEIKIWSLKTGMCMRTLQQQNTSVHCFSSNADVSMLACGAADGEMQVWDLQTTSQVNGHQYELEVTCLKILPNNLLAVGLKNGMLTNGSIRGYTINIYNLKDNSDNINLSEHTSRIQCITIFNGDMISCTANEVKIWDLNSFTCRSTIAGNYEEGEKLYMFHYADTVRIVKQKYEIITTISLEEFIKEWDVKIAQEKATLENANKGWISSLIFGWY